MQSSIDSDSDSDGVSGTLKSNVFRISNNNFKKKNKRLIESDEDDDDDEEERNNKRMRRVSIGDHPEEDEEEDEEELESKQGEEEDEDEIVIMAKSEKKKKHIQTVDLVEEDDDDEDYDEGNNNEEHDEEDTILDELYDEEGNHSSRSLAAQTKVNSYKQSIVDFIQNATEADLESIPGVSQKKAIQIIAMRPLKSWDDLNKKISNHASSAINEDIIVNTVKTMKSRKIVEKLMNDCERISKDITNVVEQLPEARQPKCLNSNMTLAPYQLIGLNWLALMYNRNINGILADEMGLGKTIQVIAFLAYLREAHNLKRHHLIIVPASTLDNWQREFETWCPDVKIIQYYGTQEYRSQVRFFIASHKHDVDVVLTTYNVVQNAEDRRLFKKIKFEYLIFDEAHMLKNLKTSRCQNLIKIKSKRRILLTGTPLQNNLVELMSLLVFTMPRLFMPKIAHVEAMFSSASRQEGGKTTFESNRIEQAKKIMKPFILRRLKKDVLKNLPQKSENTIMCPMSESQEELYVKMVESFAREINNKHGEIFEDDDSFSREESTTENVSKGAGMLMRMRKVANHPLLILNLYTTDMLRKMSKLMLQEPTHRNADPQLIYEDMTYMNDFELHKLCTLHKSISAYKLSDEKILNSGKFRQLDELLEKTKRSKERCLLFSQFVMLLDIIEEYLMIRGYKFIRLDGSTKVGERIDLIDHFNHDDEVFVFILSTKAGGLGINLTAANVVVIHDIDFNPYNDQQAMDRSHRVGQCKEVSVYKLISRNTVEEGMLSIANEKLKLGHNMTESNCRNEIVTKDLKSLLRSTLNI